MSETTDGAPWLDLKNGSRFSVIASCAIGRSESNQISLADSKVSRRHAVVHAQGEQEFWLVDLGSANGTYLNGRRVAQPTRLRDRDAITIGDALLIFRQPGTGSDAHQSIAAATICEIKTAPCWLLLADIINSTELSSKFSPEKLSIITGTWLAQCKEIIERNHGSINKFLGDGLFAYWPGPNQSDAVSQALLELKRLQSQQSLAFRLVVHHGEIALGGRASLGEESLAGADVNFVFRMEKLAGSLKHSGFISAAAKAKLSSAFVVQEAGVHRVASFEGEFTFFSF